MRVFSVLLCCVLCVLTLVAGRIYTLRKMPTGVAFEAKLEWANQFSGFAFVLRQGNRLTDYWNYGVDSADPAAVRQESARRLRLLESELQSQDNYYKWLCLTVNLQPQTALTLEYLDEIEKRHSGHWNLNAQLFFLTNRCGLKSKTPNWRASELEQGLLALCQQHKNEVWDMGVWRLVFYQVFGNCKSRGELLECYRRWREIAPQQVGWQSTVDASLLESTPRLFSEQVFLQQLIKELHCRPDQPLTVVP